MIPVGILTRDRPVLLDATLRSLSGTELPADVSVTVFDDFSESSAARIHLYTDAVQRLGYEWPCSGRWHDAGLQFLEDSPAVHGLAGRVRVRVLGWQPLGVVCASSRAVCWLFEQHQAEAVILLQDDIVLTPDWYERLIATPGDLVAGFTSEWFPKHNGFACGVCLLVRRSLFDAALDWFQRRHCERKGFDNMLSKEIARLGLTIGYTTPDVCQHLGHESQVRPDRPFYAAGGWRMSPDCPPVYGWADEVRRLVA